MTDQWVPGPPPPPPQWTDPLPPANSWDPAAGCEPGGGPSIVEGIVVSGVPATVVAPYAWGITLNDGGAPPNFTIDHYDGTNTLIDHPLEFSGIDGSATFLHPVYLSENPVQPMEAATKAYVDAMPPGEAPMDNQTYGRDNGAWVALPQIIPEAPNTSQIFGRFNSVWASVPIQADAPSDGGTYGRQNGAWNPALALTGGTITGSLTVNQVLTVQGSNSLVLNAPVTGGNQRAILSMSANVARWQLVLGDGTAEGLNNVGSNFALAAYGNTGALLGSWLTITRATGSTALNGPVTMNNGASVNGLFALNSVGNFYLPGGAPGQMLATDGAGILSWQTPPGAAGGVPEAPQDGTAYARKSAAWAHLTHTDITDWTATLAPYALTASVPAGSSTLPLMDGAAAIGTGTTWARADHVHPVDTSRYAASNPSGYQTAAQVTAVVPVASTTAPLMNGAAAPGSSAAWSRGDHVHPTDTSRYAASNPSGYQTAAQVTTSLNAYLPLIGGSLTGALGGTTASFSGALSATSGTFNGAVSNTGETIAAATPTLVLNKAASGGQSVISGQTAGSVRWQMALGNTTAEGAGNAGSDLALTGFSNTGALLGTYLTINRSNGQAAFNGAGITQNASAGVVPGYYLAKAGVTQAQVYCAAATTDFYMQNIAVGTYLQLDAAGDFSYTGGTGVAYKTGGGSWTAPSDARIKTVIGDYGGGLAEVLRLEPIVYVYNGNDAPPDGPSPHAQVAASGKPFVGLVAQEVETILPSMVTQGPGYVDGRLVDDLRSLDPGELVYALINAMKELKAEIDALKGPAVAPRKTERRHG
jgi:hypothetical protein